MYISSDWCRDVWAVNKNEFLRHIRFYFRLAWFTYWSLHPGVDNIVTMTSFQVHSKRLIKLRLCPLTF